MVFFFLFFCWPRENKFSDKFIALFCISEGTAMKDYLNNLDRLVIYVDNKSKAEDASSVSGNMCGYVSKLNGALLSHKIHVQCVRPQKGRYVLVEAWGSHNSWSRLFSAVLCEVLVYAWYLCIFHVTVTYLS